ncbi:MAG: helix-turn-helix transcriptional regulator [Bauldia sp.]
MSTIPTEVASQITAAINRAIMMKGITQLMIAHDTGYDPKTIRKMINGQSVHPQTIIDTCEYLGVDFESFFEQKSDARVADDEYGAYNYASVQEYLGDYYLYRRKFDPHMTCVCSAVKIFWSDVVNALAFHHDNKSSDASGATIDHSQAGLIHISPMIGLIHMVTIAKGAVRLITLHRMRFPENFLYGVLLTQSDEKLYWKPSVSPVVMEKVAVGGIPSASAFGVVAEKSERYAGIANRLALAEKQFVNFAVHAAP